MESEILQHLLNTGFAGAAILTWYGVFQKMFEKNNETTNYENKTAQEPVNEPEYTGLFKLSKFRYDYEQFDKNADTVTVYIHLVGSTLELYIANEQIPFKELHNEPKITLTFNKLFVFNLSKCEVILEPKWPDRNGREHNYPITIKLIEDALINEITISSSCETGILVIVSGIIMLNFGTLSLFARSDRDKFFWFKIFNAATKKHDILDWSVDVLTSIHLNQKAYNEGRALYVHRKTQGEWINRVLSRIIEDENTKKMLEVEIRVRIQEYIRRFETNTASYDSMVHIKLQKVDLNEFKAPRIIGMSEPYKNFYGIWADIMIQHVGKIKIKPEIKLHPRLFNTEDINNSQDLNIFESLIKTITYYCPFIQLDKLKFNVEINLEELTGGLSLNIPEAPTDVVWLGFRPGTKLKVNADFGLWSRIPFLFFNIEQIIESKSNDFFNKFFIVPNMIQIPISFWKNCEKSF